MVLRFSSTAALAGFDDSTGSPSFSKKHLAKQYSWLLVPLSGTNEVLLEGAAGLKLENAAVGSPAPTLKGANGLTLMNNHSRAVSIDRIQQGAKITFKGDKVGVTEYVAKLGNQTAVLEVQVKARQELTVGFLLVVSAQEQEKEKKGVVVFKNRVGTVRKLADCMTAVKGLNEIYLRQTNTQFKASGFWYLNRAEDLGKSLDSAKEEGILRQYVQLLKKPCDYAIYFVRAINREDGEPAGYAVPTESVCFVADFFGDDRNAAAHEKMLKLAVAHELGHLLYLRHVDEPFSSLMQPSLDVSSVTSAPGWLSKEQANQVNSDSVGGFHGFGMDPAGGFVN